MSYVALELRSYKNQSLNMILANEEAQSRPYQYYVVVVVLLLTTKSHTDRSHVSNIFTCLVIYSKTYLSSTRNMIFSYRSQSLLLSSFERSQFSGLFV